MSIYIITILILFGLAAKSKKFSKNRRKFFVLMFSVWLIFVTGFRSAENVGVDMGRYSTYYSEIKKNSIIDAALYNKGASILYYLSCWFFGKAGFSFQAFIFIISAIIIFCVSRYIYKYSTNVLMSYLVFFGMGIFSFMFSGLRQMLAMAIILPCCSYYDERKTRAFIFLFIIACLFHYTALAMVPYFLMRRFRFSDGMLLIYIIIATICIFFGRSIGRRITFLFGSVYIDYYEQQSGLGVTTIMCMLLTALYLAINYKEIHNMNNKKSGYAHGLFLATVIQSLSSYGYLFTRLNLFYMLAVMMIVLPSIFTKTKDIVSSGGRQLTIIKPDTNAIAVVCMLCVIAIMLYLFFFHIKNEFIDNYMFFWS